MEKKTRPTRSLMHLKPNLDDGEKVVSAYMAVEEECRHCELGTIETESIRGTLSACFLYVVLELCTFDSHI